MVKMDLSLMDAENLLSDVESSESDDDETISVLGDDQSKESSYAGVDDEPYKSEDESSFISHQLPLASLSICGSSDISVTSVESALPRCSSMDSIESALSSTGDITVTSGEYSSDEEEDYIVKVNMSPAKPRIKPRTLRNKKFGNGSRNSSDNSLDGAGSCNSIKDLLRIDSISEDMETANAPAIEYHFDNNGDIILPVKMGTNNLLNKIVQSTQNMELSGTNLDLLSTRPCAPTKSSKFDDPLMNKYLNKKQSKGKKTVKAISSILGSSDSLNHMKGSKGKRVVKTRAHSHPTQEGTVQADVAVDSKGGDDDSAGGFAEFSVPMKGLLSPPAAQKKPCAPRRTLNNKKATSSASARSLSKDPLMQRYMNMKRASSEKISSSSAMGLMSTFDSLNDVGGKGQRIVKTRTREAARAF